MEATIEHEPVQEEAEGTTTTTTAATATATTGDTILEYSLL
jgi:hypothetical protein